MMVEIASPKVHVRVLRLADDSIVCEFDSHSRFKLGDYFKEIEWIVEHVKEGEEHPYKLDLYIE